MDREPGEAGPAYPDAQLIDELRQSRASDAARESIGGGERKYLCQLRPLLATKGSSGEPKAVSSVHRRHATDRPCDTLDRRRTTTMIASPLMGAVSGRVEQGGRG